MQIQKTKDTNCYRQLTPAIPSSPRYISILSWLDETSRFRIGRTVYAKINPPVTNTAVHTMESSPGPCALPSLFPACRYFPPYFDWSIWACFISRSAVRRLAGWQRRCLASSSASAGTDNHPDPLPHCRKVSLATSPSLGHSQGVKKKKDKNLRQLPCYIVFGTKPLTALLQTGKITRGHHARAVAG